MTDYSKPVNTTGFTRVVKPVDFKNRHDHPQKDFYFWLEAVQNVLAGDQRYVTHMFTWADTPREFNWATYQDSSYFGHTPTTPRPLPEEYKAFLRWLIRPEEKDKGE